MRCFDVVSKYDEAAKWCGEVDLLLMKGSCARSEVVKSCAADAYDREQWTMARVKFAVSQAAVIVLLAPEHQ